MPQLTKQFDPDAFLKKAPASAGFDPDAFLQKNTAPSVGKGESFLRGASQGATFGWQEELSAPLEKLIGTIADNEAYQNKSVADLKQTYREQNKAAEAAHPGAYLGGEIAGGTITTLPMSGYGGGAARAATTVGKIFTKEGAKIIGREALRGGAEGALIGGIQGAGSAEGAMNSAIAGAKGVGMGGVAGAVLSAAAKPVVDRGLHILEKTIQSAQKIPNRVLQYVRDNPDKIEIIRTAAANKNQAIADTAADVADGLGAAFNKIVTRENGIIDSFVEGSGNHPIDVSNIISAIDNEISTLQKGALTPDPKSAISALLKIKEEFMSRFGKSPGVAEMPAGTVNILRKEFNDLARGAYNRKLGTGNPVLAKAAAAIGDATREALDSVSPEIRKANLRLKRLIEKRQLVAKKFGAPSLLSYENEIDPADVQKILTRLPSEHQASNKSHVSELAELTGIDLPGQADFIDAVKAFEAEGSKLASKWYTGRSLLQPLTFGALGTAGGYASGQDPAMMGLLGALGLLAGAGSQSKAGLQLMLKNKEVRGAAGKAVDMLRRGISQQMGRGAGEPIEFEPSVVMPRKKN